MQQINALHIGLFVLFSIIFVISNFLLGINYSRRHIIDIAKGAMGSAAGAGLYEGGKQLGERIREEIRKGQGGGGKPTDPKPTDPKPTDPKPTDSKPTGSKPTGSKS